MLRTQIYHHALATGFARAFLVSAGILALIVVIALFMMRVSPADLSGADPAVSPHPAASPHQDRPAPVEPGPYRDARVFRHLGGRSQTRQRADSSAGNKSSGT